MAQIQLTQQALMLGHTMDNDNLLLKEVKKDRERHASETTLASSEGSLKENRSENVITRHNVNGSDSKCASPPVVQQNNSSSVVQKLFSHGHCAWPGCDTALPDSAAFYRHLSTHHILDDKSMVSIEKQT